MIVKRLIPLSVLSAGLISAICPALAQNPGSNNATAFPNRPLRLMVGYPPGGATDIIARMLGQKLTDTLGQQVLIVNRPGAGGILATETIATSTPDGYSIVLVTTSHGINPSLYPKLPYDSIKSFAPITQVATLQQVLVVNPALPAHNLKELIAMAKAQPGKLNFGSSGNGQALHLSGELFKSMAGINLVHVPYSGSAPARTALLGGEIQMMFESMIGVLPAIKSGSLRAIAVSGAQRSAAAADIPTMSEAGVPGFEASAWVGVLAPSGTPKAVVGRLHADSIRVLKMPEVKELLARNGAEPVGNTPEQFTTFIGSEIAKWSKVVKGSGARLD